MVFVPGYGNITTRAESDRREREYEHACERAYEADMDDPDFVPVENPPCNTCLYGDELDGERICLGYERTVGHMSQRECDEQYTRITKRPLTLSDDRTVCEDDGDAD
jgi:hypothetical protein